MARSIIRRGVTTSVAFGLLTSCFVPKYSEFESDAGSAGHSSTGGDASLSGSSATGGSTAVAGNSSSAGSSNGSSGGAASGASSVGGAGGAGAGGTSAGAGTATTGGADATGGAGAAGGATATGGSAALGGMSSTGGAGNTGGKTNVGGISSTGGVSGLPTGGAGNTGGNINVGGVGTSTGGVSTSTGGVSTGTGGVSTSTGGTSPSTGGAASNTGGVAAVTGGASNTGGANPTGGNSATGGVTGTGGATIAPVPVQIAAGYQHSCAVLSDHTVWCWGDNASGKLGISTATIKSPIPVKVQFPGTSASVKAVAVGDTHSCAVLSDATAQCWGANNYGQLGDGTTTSTSSPVVVLASAGITQTDIQSISLGGGFTCAVVADSTYTSVAKCWGTASSGELGIGCTGSGCNARYPSTVVTNTTTRPPLSVVSSVSAGGSHACAVLTTGATYCWGSNAYGQLGNGTTTGSNLPLQVLNSANAPITATNVSAGTFATCALVNSGVQCWGRNDYGQVGNESTNIAVLQELRAVPVTVAANPIQSVTQISAGFRNACAVLTSGDVYCWGDGGSGQLGLDPNTITMRNCSSQYPLCSSTPLLVDSLSSLKPNVKVSCGNQFMIAWDNAGTSYGLGYDYYGQLGDGNTTYTNFAPVPVSASWR